ncbi:hypothetical protein CTI14_03885 [Methylobacterium radiotolerans]|nr:hypothetical protein CTI14_03885 [Methylobacterium radiotolerans]
MMRRSALFALLCTTSLMASALAQSTTALKKSIQANYLSINDLAQRGQLKVQMRRCPNVGPEFSLMTDAREKLSDMP